MTIVDGIHITLYHLRGIIYCSCSRFDVRCGIKHDIEVSYTTCYSFVVCHYTPVALVAYQVYLEPGIGQFREFEPRRLHTRINSLGLFLVHKLTCGKRESVS